MEVEHKSVPPTQVIEFLEVTFNSVQGTMEVSPDRLKKLNQMLGKWLQKSHFSRKQLEQLIGKLQFVAACVRPGRIFISRLLNSLHGLNLGQKWHPMNENVRKDLCWWKEFLPQYNGVSVAWMRQHPTPDELLSTDASSVGLAGYFTDKAYFRMRVPDKWLGVNIAYLELWAIIVSLKVWGVDLRGCRFTFQCDNEAVVNVLTYGRSRDLFLQAGMREVAYLLATHECEMKVVYIPTGLNKVADNLSRWVSPAARRAFNEFARDRFLKHVRVSYEDLKFTHNW